MSTSDDLAGVRASLATGDVPPSRGKGLSRERILAAALDYIDEQGVSGLTMRRLGSLLGVEAMALYRHVAGKDELLDAVVDELLAAMWSDDAVRHAPADGWQDFLRHLAHGVRRVALTHPRAFPLIASRPTVTTWLRPPLGSLDMVEVFMTRLVDAGFSDEDAVTVYRAYTSFLLGHLLLEAPVRAAEAEPLDGHAPEGVAGPDLERFPQVHRLGPALSEDRGAAEFEGALASLLERLAALTTAP